MLIFHHSWYLSITPFPLKCFKTNTGNCMILEHAPLVKEGFIFHNDALLNLIKMENIP